MAKKKTSRKSGQKTRVATAARQEEVAKLYCQGVSIRKIASLLGVHTATIQSDIKTVRKHWGKAISDGIEAQMVQELAKIDYLEQRSWIAYNKSEQQLDPDPRYLAMIDKCIQRRIELLGLGKVSDNNSGVDDRPIVAVVVSSRDEVNQVQKWSDISGKEKDLKIEGPTEEDSPAPPPEVEPVMPDVIDGTIVGRGEEAPDVN